MIVSLGSENVRAVLNDYLILAPTSDIMSSEMAVSANVFAGTRNALDLDFNYRFHPQFKVGLTLALNGEGSGFEPAVKYNLIPDQNGHPAISAGIKGRDIYMVFSTFVEQDFRVHAGVGTGQFESIFIGLNKTYEPVQVELGPENINEIYVPPLNVMVEFVNRKLNAGIRANIQSNLFVELAVLNLEDFKAGVSIVF